MALVWNTLNKVQGLDLVRVEDSKPGPMIGAAILPGIVPPLLNSLGRVGVQRSSEDS